ncbi:MAG: alpha/beta hydrolase [Ktedonobacteraceae bacterium]
MFKNIRSFRPSLKQILFGGLGGGIGIIGVLLAGAIYVVETLVRPTKKRGVFEDYTFSPFELDLPAENVAFAPIRGDHKVSGWFVSHPDATTTIIVCPGYRTRKSDMLGIGTKLWHAGHNILIFEYYGHGMDIGTPVTLGYREINDFLGAVAFAKERAPHTRLGVVAYSMGASTAIMGSAQNTDVEALVLDSPFASHWGVVDYNVRRVFPVPSAPFVWLADQLMWWRAKYHFHQVEPLRDIGKISPRPILLIQGGKDSVVDPGDANLLFKAAGEPKELWFLPEVDHCGAYFIDRYAYAKKVTDFFELYLKTPRLQMVENNSAEYAETPAVNTTMQNLPEAS